MILVNGIATDNISAQDRGLLYGDGLFETIAIKNGIYQHLNQHLKRLTIGCERLGIPTPDLDQLREELTLINHSRGVVKIIITRGQGGRGYRSPEPVQPTRVISFHPWPEYPADHQQGVRVRVCNLRISTQPALAGIKHLNRLENVLARNEWQDTTIAEGLLRDQQGHFIEGTMSNLFMVKNGALHTSSLDQCGVAGVIREIVLELASQNGIECHIQNISEAMLKTADELFITNSVIGIWPVVEVMGYNHYLKGTITQQLQTLLEGTE
jgi:4-amino-4-deoxychorismate lyase